MVMESNSMVGQDTEHEDISEYVAHLQLHMTLQARNLVPSLNPKIQDSREQLLHQTQANVEKLISRQTNNIINI